MLPRDFLKEQTRIAHQKVDLQFSRFELADAAGYRCFLEAHHAVLAVCERILALSGAAGLISDWPTRVRTPALEEDLKAMGSFLEPDRAPVTALVPAAAFGLMYVLEGSRVGGAVLAARLRSHPGPHCREATRYLLHGNGLRLWPSFVALLNSSPHVLADIDTVLASALRTFELFEAAAVSANA
ncbi:MAG: biliverdin-producing heme oxygenase [Polaromonas sp.]